MFGGQLYRLPIEGWHVSWESVGAHRLWCYQSRGNDTHLVCVVMFNPGSLSGDGKGLAKDDTLRIIRSAMPDGTAVLVLNLFTLATPKPPELFLRWDERISTEFEITPFQSLPIDALVYAFGDLGQSGKQNRQFGDAVRERIAEITEAMRTVPRLELPAILVSQARNPKHPKHWKLHKQIGVVKDLLDAHIHAER